MKKVTISHESLSVFRNSKENRLAQAQVDRGRKVNELMKRGYSNKAAQKMIPPVNNDKH